RVDERAVVARVRALEVLDEDGDVRTGRAGRHPELADHADLPQDERRRGVEAAPVDDELRRLVALETGHPGIDPEVGDEAVERRDGRQHAGAKAFGARPPDGLVPRPREDAGMAVEDGADGAA